MKRSGFKPRTKPMARGDSQLKRSPFKQLAEPKQRLGTVSPLQRKSVIAPIGQRSKRMRQGKVQATAEEAAWMDAAQEFGCIACWVQVRMRTPAAIHHIIQGSRRMGHFWTLPLCDPGHHQGSTTPLKTSRHPDKARFESAYGTEFELLALVRKEVGKKHPQLIGILPPIPDVPFDISQ